MASSASGTSQEAAGAAAPSTTTTVGSQARHASGASARSPSEVLAEAARRIEAEAPWYETLGLGCGQAAGGGGAVTVKAVLAFNVVSGVIDAANETVLAPVFVVLEGLLGAVQGAAAAREEIVELIRYCVGISRCLLEAAGVEDMPGPFVATLVEFKGEMEAVGRFVQTYSTRTGGCCRKMALNSDDRDTVAHHKQKLKDLLDAVLAGFIIENTQGVNKIKGMVTDRDPPRLVSLAEVPRGAPILPPTYVPRTALVEAVVDDLTDPQRSATATHCLLGMGGGGKTLTASSVVRDDRVRASFKNGIFWVPVGREGKDVARLLEYLAMELARVPTDTPHRCPHRFEGVEEVARHLSAVREDNGLRCLVVLDNVWSVEVVNAFASTGFHVVVTTRQSTVISPSHSGLRTEVGDMSEEDALEVLRKASGAHGPLPAQAAREVAHDCGLLPLALGMVGTLAKEQPLDPSSWLAVHEKLHEKRSKFRQMENGKLFSTIDTSVCALPLTQREQMQLMAVLASGAFATTEMLANLWAQDIGDVATGTSVLVDRCLLQDLAGGYRLHDLVLEYLQLTIKMHGGLAEMASSRQARYLGRFEVFHGYVARGHDAITGGLYSLVSLWNSVKKLDETVNVGVCYAQNIKTDTDLRTLTDVGFLLSLLGQFDYADFMHLAAIVGQGVCLGPDHPQLAATLNNRALMLQTQGKYEEAGALHLRAIGIAEKALPPDHPSLASSLSNLADVLKEKGTYGEADVLYLRAIEIQEKSLPPDHPHLAGSLSSRADLLHAQGKYQEADALYVRAIEIREKALGANHPELAASLNNRALMLQAQGKYEEAEALYLRVIGIHDKTLGPDHPHLASSLNNRASILREQGKLEEAGELFRRVIGIQEKALGPDHRSLAASLNNMALVLQAQGKLEEADEMFLGAIRIQERALGPDHPELATALANRANVLTLQGNYDDANALYLTAIDIQEIALGPDHPHLARSLTSIMFCSYRQGHLDEARSLLERALAIQTMNFGGAHKDTIDILNLLKVLDDELQFRNALQRFRDILQVPEPE